MHQQKDSLSTIAATTFAHSPTRSEPGETIIAMGEEDDTTSLPLGVLYSSTAIGTNKHERRMNQDHPVDDPKQQQRSSSSSCESLVSCSSINAKSDKKHYSWLWKLMKWPPQCITIMNVVLMLFILQGLFGLFSCK